VVLFTQHAAMRHLTLAALLISSQALAADKPDFSNVDPAVRAWYRDAMITDRAQHRFPHKGCCDHSDVVKTQLHG
jgi:hypothetical protein